MPMSREELARRLERADREVCRLRLATLDLMALGEAVLAARRARKQEAADGGLKRPRGDRPARR